MGTLLTHGVWALSHGWSSLQNIRGRDKALIYLRKARKTDSYVEKSRKKEIDFEALKKIGNIEGVSIFSKLGKKGKFGQAGEIKHKKNKKKFFKK